MIVDKDSKKVIGAFSYNVSNKELSNMCDNATKTLYNEFNKKGLL